MSEAVVAASAAICIAVLGALLSYASTRRLDRAKARLDRLNGDELRDYLRESFTRLKREQARELEATQGRTGQDRAISWPRRRATRGRAAGPGGQA
jgi:hypothetical protein